MTRTDIHRPSVIIPADYDYVAVRSTKVECLGDAAFILFQREQIAQHMAMTGGDYSSHYHGGNCHICGAHCLYQVVFHHRPTNAYICTGMDCADKLEWDAGDGEKFRKQVKHAMERKAGKEKAAHVLAEAGLDGAWLVFAAAPAGTDRREESIIRDIVGKLVHYGSISDAQMGFLRKLVDAVTDRAEIDAKRAAENEAAAPLPAAGRISIKGRIVSIKRGDGIHQFGDRMIVKHASGWKVMGTLPAALDEAEIGDVVEFSATIKPSDRDPKFGFFSRPTKAQKSAA